MWWKEGNVSSRSSKLYNVETKRINEAVKNNPKKFPNRFSWTSTNKEKNNLWSKFSTANISTMSRSNPRVFHCGASFKDLDKKCFGINEIENKIEIDKLIDEVIKNCSCIKSL